MPTYIISTNPIAPRMIGLLRKGYFSKTEVKGIFLTTISPFALRTAVAIIPFARIITPSMTACPPTWIGWLISNFCSLISKYFLIESKNL